MPEIHRGVAVAYCDPPGPLETSASCRPTSRSHRRPADWPPERVASFYREYNAHMLHNLTVHEAMPGHVLQLAHRALRGADAGAHGALERPVRRGLGGLRRGADGRHGLPGPERALRRAADAAAQDAAADDDQRDPRRPRAHPRHDRGRGDAADDRARPPGGGRGGRQVAPRAADRAQLSTYFVGYIEVRDLVATCAARPAGASAARAPRRVLAHGSPAPRHLRTLLGV